MKNAEGSAVRNCHWGNTFVFEWEGLKFFGAGSCRGLNTGGMDVIIDCGAGVQQESATAEPGNASSVQQQIIRIDWQDGGVPLLTENDWKSLIGKLKKMKSRSGRETLQVLVCCVGGHGRTGTALAILAALTGAAPEEPVIFVRMEYCRQAVETKAQCRYIKGIAHIVVDDSLSSPEFDSSCDSPLR